MNTCTHQTVFKSARFSVSNIQCKVNKRLCGLDLFSSNCKPWNVVNKTILYATVNKTILYATVYWKSCQSRQLHWNFTSKCFKNLFEHPASKHHMVLNKPEKFSSNKKKSSTNDFNDVDWVSFFRNVTGKWSRLNVFSYVSFF